MTEVDETNYLLKKIRFSITDYSIFALTLLISVSIGVYFGYYYKKRPTVTRYLTGDRNMKALPLALSMILCSVSSITLLALPADVYKYGATYLLTPLSVIITATVMIYIFYPVFYNLQLTSVYEYLELRFDRRARLLGSFLYIANVMLLLPVIIYIPSLALCTISDTDITTTVLLIFGLCILYTAIGGLKSVVWIDVFQSGIILASLLILLALGTIQEGGSTIIFSRAQSGQRLDIWNFNVDPTMRDNFWITIFGTASLWMSQYCINQSIVTKCLSVPTFRDCVRTVIYFGIGIIILKISSTILGLIVYAKYFDCDPITSGEIQKLDELIPFYIINVVRNWNGLPGLIFAGVYTASMSTVSTELNGVACVIYKDFISKYLPQRVTQSKVIMFLKIIVFLFGAIVVCLVFVVQEIEGMFQLALSVPSISKGPLFGIFTLGLICPKANSRGAFYGGISGIVVILSMFIPSKYYQMSGQFAYPAKSLSTENCSFLGNESYNLQHNNLSAPASFEPPYIFRISFYCYPIIGACTTLIFGSIISYLTKEKNHCVDKRLIAPVCRRFLSNNDGDENENEDEDSKYAALATNPTEIQALQKFT